MAEINVSLQNKDAPSFLGYSQVTPAGGAEKSGSSTALETATMASGFLAKGWEATVQAADTINKDTISKEAQAAVDKVQGRGEIFNADYTAPVMPDALVNVEDKLNRINSARQSGTLDETSYWTQLDVEARKLRSRYPEYREYIDNKFQAYTGSIPSNRVMHLLQAQQKRDDSVDKQIDHDLIKIGHPFAINGQLKEVPLVVKQSELAKFYQTKVRDDKTQTDYNLAKARGDLTDTLALRLGGENTINKSQYLLDQIFDLPEPGGKTVKDLIKFQVDNASNAGATKESQQVLTSIFTQKKIEQDRLAKQQESELVTKFGVKPVDAKKLVDDHMRKPFNEIYDSVIKGDWSAAQLNTSMLSISKDNAQLSSFIQNPALLAIDTYRKTLGDQSFALFFGDMQKVNPNVHAGILTSFRWMASPNTPEEKNLRAMFQRLQGSGLTEKDLEQVRKGNIERIHDMIINPSVPQDIRQLTFDFMFKNSKDAMSTIAPEERAMRFAQFTSPKMQAAVAELGGNAEYRDWVMKNFATYSRDQVKIIENMKSKPNEFDVSYDSQNFRFNVTNKPDPTVPGSEKRFQPFSYPEVERLNDNMKNVSEILKRSGRDPNRYFSDIMPSITDRFSGAAGPRGRLGGNDLQGGEGNDTTLRVMLGQELVNSQGVLALRGINSPIPSWKQVDALTGDNMRVEEARREQMLQLDKLKNILSADDASPLDKQQAIEDYTYWSNETLMAIAARDVTAAQFKDNIVPPPPMKVKRPKSKPTP